MKKTTKRALSFLLTLVMLVSTMSVGFFGITSLAATNATVDSTHQAVIAVPETVYMTPKNGASTTGQYYVNNTISGGNTFTVVPEVSANNTKGYVQLYIPGAKSVTYTASYCSGTNVGDVVASGEGTEKTFTNGYLGLNETTISVGTGLTSGQTSLVEWVFTVKMNDGSTRVYYAYSTLYAPFVSPVGAAAEAQAGSKKVYLGSIFWVDGVHSVSASGYSGATAYYPNAANFLPLTGVINIFNNSDPTSNWLQTGSNGLSNSINYLRGNEKNHRRVNVISPVANLTVDTSRYNNFNQIPNFKLGYLTTDSEGSSSGSWYIADYTGKDYENGDGDGKDVSNSTDGGSDKGRRQDYYNAPYVSLITSGSDKNCELQYHGTWNYTIPTGKMMLKAAGYSTGTKSLITYTCWNNNFIELNVTGADKAALRKEVLEGTSLNANNYVSATWEAYRTELRAAAQRLGNPTATDVSTSNLTTKRAALQTTVTLNANGGSIGTTSFNATVGTAATYNYNVASYTPTRTGYTFKGWSTSSTATSGSTSSVNAGLMPTLYATWEANKYTVVFDNLVDFSKWNTTTAGNGVISNVTDNGFTLTSNDGVGESTSSSPFFPVTPGKQYKIDIDFTGTAWDVYIFFCDANGTWIDFADGPSNRFSYGGTTGIPVDNAVFTAPDKAEVVKAQIRVDANNGNNTVRFENIRVYEVGTVEDGVSYENSKTVTYNSTYGTLPTPTRDGYEFLGWYKADGSKLNATDTVNITDTLHVTSQWKKSGYTITWKVDGQQDVTSIAAAGAMPVYPNGTPTKAATAQYTYTFTGWSPSLVAATSDATYTAQFSQTTNKYKVTWIVDGSTAKEEYVEYGQTPSFGSTPTKEADDEFTYTFSSWSPAVEKVTKDATYTAQFSNTTRKYTVTWLNDDNSVIRIDENIPYGTTPTAPANPTKAANAQYTYTFDKWTPTVDKITGDTTYKATYTATLNKYTVNWVVDNEIYHTEQVEYGTKPTLPATPTKAADAQYTYTFKEWSPTVTAVMNDTNYTAVFDKTVNKYKVTWYDEDGTTVLYSADFDYGSTPVYGAANPTKAATDKYTYTFAGWDRAYEAVTKATSYKATYSSTVNEYTIEFVNHDGTVLQTGKVAYDETPVYSGDTPTKDRTAQYTYVFTGWDPAIAKVTGDATYTAQFESTTNVYTVTWVNYDGTTLETDENVPYGTMPEYNGATPTKPQTDKYEYTFADKWSPEVDEVTGDVTYTAQFTEKVRKYTVTWMANGQLIYHEEVEYDTVPVYNEAVYGTPSKTADAQYTYTFKDWTPEVSAVKGAVTYVAEFNEILNTYTVTWVDEDGTELEKDENVPYGTMPEFNGTTPTKAATAQYTYTFDKWTPTVETVKGNVEYKATYKSSVNQYTVTWNDENDNPVRVDADKDYNTVLTPPEAPVKASSDEFDYVFAGWKSSVTGETVNGNVTVTGTATYTATYTPVKRSYTITWVIDGKEETTSVEYGAMPTHAAPTKEATAEYTYTFAGWDPEITAVTGDATYTAKFNATKNSYTITWKNDDGSVIDTTTVEYGVKPTHADATKANTAEYTYTFAGWDPEVVSVTGDATYKATFTAEKNKYTITWLDDEGNEIDTTTVEYGVVPTHADATKANTAEYTYTFAGWTPEVVSVTGDATYKATFTAEKNKYTITWLDDEGNEIDTTTVEYGVVPSHADATKDRTPEYTYTFAGWDPEVVAVTGDATYKATFTATKNKYTVTWVIDGVEETQEYEYGATPSHTTPTKKADAQYTYTFKSWTPAIAEVTENATYTAVFDKTVNEYTITWIVDGKTTTEKVAYGATPSHTAPTKAADAQYTYTFKEWSPAIEEVTEDATYTAVFDKTVNKYTITWIVDGEETTTEVAYGETPDFGSTPTKDATPEFTYTFKEWTPAVVAVTGEATYEAVFTATTNTYTVTWVDENGTVLETDENVPYGATPEFNKANPTKAQDAQYTYAFAGWDKDVVKVTGDVTYTATYKGTVRSYEIKWVVDGNTVKTELVEYGTIPAFGEDPTKAADAEFTYTFKGWDNEVVAVTGPATYTAEFTPARRSYTITWKNDDGSVIDTTTVEYGQMPTHADAVKAETPEFTYTFAGWTPSVVSVTGEATYTAKFTPVTKSYKVTWVDADGTTILFTEDVLVGATIPTKEVPAKDGFIGVWGSYPATMPTNDITIKAEYFEDGIKVNWVIDDTTTHQTAVRRGETIAPEAEWQTKAPSVSTVYTFVGWSETKGGAIVNTFPTVTESDTEAKTYYAVFTESVREYTITWIVDGESETTKVAYGSMPTHADPTKAATAQYTYEFAGWTPAVVEVSGDATYTAQFDANVNYYTVTWIVDGEVKKTEDVAYGSTPTFGEDPTKAGNAQYTYTFAGWDPAVSSVTGKATYTAKFNATVNKYTVTWVDDNGTVLETDTGVEYGTKPSFDKANPTKAATAQYTYTFAGWEGLTSETTVTGDVTFKATYSSTVNKYTVTWVDENGTVLETDTGVEFGTKPSFDKANPTKAATAQYTYTFAGWEGLTDDTTVEGNVTFTAKYTSTVNKYTVTWVDEDDTVLETDTDVPYGTEPSYDGTTPTKTATAQYTYAFAGWEPVVAKVEGNVTYKATYTSIVNKYTVTWVDEGGTVLETDENVPYGTKPVFNGTTPTKAATAQYTYTFAGWEGLTSETTVTGDVTFKATYSSTVNNYTVTWVIDGVETKETYAYGATPSHTDPEKAADVQYTYTFAGWDKEIADVTGDATYTAQFDKTLNKYTVTWVIDGVTSTEEYEYGATPSHAAPTKAADVQYTYTFAGWDKELATVTGDVTYTAKFNKTLNKYTITWVIDGKETTEEYEYGATPSHADPEKAADAQYTYTFTGWDKELATVTGNATYTAQFSSTVNTYTVTWDIDGAKTTETYEYGATPSYKGTTPERAATAQYTYTFAGWNGLTDDTTVKGDVTFTAKFDSTVNTYAITWKNADGTTIKSEQVAFGTTPSYAGETPVKTGDAQYSYVFSGWTPAVTAVTGAAEYTAKFEQVVNKYTVTWVVEGKTVETDTNVPYGTDPDYNGSVPTKASTAQYSYTFAGWTPTVSEVTGDVEYTATFTEETRSYTITWKDDNGSVIDTTTVKFGTVPTHADPSKAADAQYTYTFAGWDTAPVAVTGDATYTATYTSTVNKYTVTWVVEGTTVETDENVEYGKTPSYDGETPVKAGDAQYSYTFDKWTPEVSDVTGDVTYTATFTKTVNKYTITWIVNDTVTTQQVEYGTVPAFTGSTDKAPDNTTVYTFAGWDAEPVAVTGDATYTATYSEAVRKYTITWIVNGSETTEQYEYNAVPSFKGSTDIPSTPSTTYVFKGWDKELVNVTGDATYTAVYDVTVKTYKITWANADGTVIYSEDVEYGKIPSYKGETPTKESSATETYAFAGWDKTPVVAESDATYTATFTASPRMYTVTWIVDGNIVRTETVAYNAVIPAHALPADKEGHTVKWDNTLTVMPASDLTITAVYTPRMYPVYWVVDGITVYSASVPYGTAIPEKAVPAKDGHSGKWVNIPATMPADIVIINAEYTARSYQVFWKIGNAQDVETATYGQDLVLAFDVETLPEDLRITVNGIVLAADKYEYDAAAGTLKIYGTAITGNINIIAKSTSGSVGILYSIFGGKSSNTDEIIDMRTTYHTTITPAAGNLIPKTVAIYVDGILVTDGYSYDPATGKLTINAEVIVGELEIYAECLEDPNYNPTENCDCSCHSKNALVKFFFTIFNFLRELFGMKQYQYCECGVAHW